MFFEVGVGNFSLNRFIKYFSKRRKPKVWVSIGENEIKFDLLSAADRFPLLFQSKVVEIRLNKRYMCFCFPNSGFQAMATSPSLLARGSYRSAGKPCLPLSCAYSLLLWALLIYGLS